LHRISPALRKQIEKWLDEKDEELARRRLTDLVGREEAQHLMDTRHKKRRR